MPKRKKTANGERFGHWIFLIGVLIAVVAGLLAVENQMILWILAVIGIIVGLLNVTIKDEVPFLLASVALILAANAFSVLPIGIGDILSSILNNVVAFVSPAAVIVALKAVYTFASKEK